MASRDPSSKRGSAGASTPQYRYPLNGNMQFYTRMEFFKYDRRIEEANANRTSTGVIILPIPTSITDNSGMNINSNNLGMFETVLQAYRSGNGMVKQAIEDGAAKTTDNVVGGVKSVLSSINDMELSQLGTLAALLPGVSDLAIGNFAEVTQGIVRNPHTTSAFNGVNLKRYTFEWRVSPRSQEEGDRLLQVLNVIRNRMHPSFNETVRSYAFDYPDLVTIEFKNTKGLPEVDFSFIAEFSVNSAPQGPAFYKDGMPVEIGFNMTLIETDVRTRESYGG